MLHLLSSVSNCQHMPNTGSNEMCSMAVEQEPSVSDASCPGVPGPSNQDSDSAEVKEKNKQKKISNEMCSVAGEEESPVSDADCPSVLGPSKQVSKNEDKSTEAKGRRKKKNKKKKTPLAVDDNTVNEMCSMAVELQSVPDAGCPGVPVPSKQISKNEDKSTVALEKKKKKKKPLSIHNTRWSSKQKLEDQVLFPSVVDADEPD